MSVSRLDALVAESNAIIDRAMVEHFSTHRVAATVILYSGGNDSTTLAHLFRDRATHAAHCNTGIGIEQTRDFVRNTCEEWGLPLIEVHPPTSYADLVIERGFPGPGQHFKMYQRLKERGLRQVRKQFVTDPRRERVLMLAGRRRDESQRRMLIPECDRVGSMVFVSPLANWTKLDLNEYRRQNPDVPRNEVADLIHMSGECLCGAFAHKGELEEIGYWFPEVAVHIADLEEQVRAAGHPEERCRWGWGAYRDDVKPSRSGLMCSSCEGQLSLFEEAAS